MLGYVCPVGLGLPMNLVFSRVTWVGEFLVVRLRGGLGLSLLVVVWVCG